MFLIGATWPVGSVPSSSWIGSVGLRISTNSSWMDWIDEFDEKFNARINRVAY